MRDSSWTRRILGSDQDCIASEDIDPDHAEDDTLYEKRGTTKNKVATPFLSASIASRCE